MSNVISAKFSFTIEALHSFLNSGSRGQRNDRIADAIDIANASSGVNKIDRAGYLGSQTLAAAGTGNFDLAGTTFLDPEGVGLSMAKLKLVAIWNRIEVAGEYLVWGHKSSGGLANNTVFADVSDRMTVQPAGRSIWEALRYGVAVTPTTADSIAITNNGAAAANFDILVLGTST